MESTEAKTSGTEISETEMVERIAHHMQETEKRGKEEVKGKKEERGCFSKKNAKGYLRLTF